MKKVEFSKDTNNTYEVAVNGDSFGTLQFDTEQGVWVLWPNNIDDAVSYENSLDETKELITDEIQSYTD